jgi:hypothetical protein
MSQWFNLRADTELGLGRFEEALEDARSTAGIASSNAYLRDP